MERDDRNLFYEYGFTCGGILTVGFCQYLNRLGRELGIDRFLFVARDGDILRKVYRRYFEERPHAYLVFSRFASLELIFESDPEEYIEENIYRRIRRKGADNSVGAILAECGIGVLSPALAEAGLTAREELTEAKCPALRALILKHRREVAAVFAESREAAGAYFLSAIGDARRVCVVDIGWRGTSVIYLRELLAGYGWEGTLVGALIGVNGDQVTQAYIRSGFLHPFAFESPAARRLSGGQESGLDVDEVICMEALFSSEEDTLLRYCRNGDGSTGFIYGAPNRNREVVRQMQTGVLDFCDVFVPFLEKYDLTVTARDAWAPLDAAMRNRRYRRMIRRGYRETPGAMNGFGITDEAP